MLFIHTRLFFRILSRNREVYLLKIATLAISFACSTLILLFSINEFGYDKFHRDYNSIIRILQKNIDEAYNGNRLSNKIPVEVFRALRLTPTDSLITSRVKLMDRVKVVGEKQFFDDSKVYAADPEIGNIFSFEMVNGSLKEFQEMERTVILSSATSYKYFGTTQSIGRKLGICSLGDTVFFTVAAVYKNYPRNSHEEFNCFVRFDSATIRSLHFNADDTGIYGKLLRGSASGVEANINKQVLSRELTYKIQPISEIYFGPRVRGEDSKHGDQYSIFLLIWIIVLILFLGLTNYVNLTTLTLPYRSKELAIKKLAGTRQAVLLMAFAKESILIVGISLALGILILVVLSGWIEKILSINLLSLFLHGDLQLILIVLALFLVTAMAPLFLTLRFTRASPSRLLGTETITFPRFKRTIMFLQLGISIFLLVASMVIRRQIDYSLLKEPGRNHEQIVYIRCPKGLTNEDLMNLRANWKKNNANVVDIMATSQLPDRVSSKELGSEFYFMSVDRGFKDFFELEMVQGSWFRANDGDSMVVVNELGSGIPNKTTDNVVGVFKDISEQFNQPGKPIRMNVASYFNYNFLCIRILEVDIRKTVRFVETYFEQDGEKATVAFLNKRFEEWLRYQDRLNSLSDVLAIISALLSCCAIYGLSISIVRDKLKQIAIHKLLGASTFSLTRLLVKEFVRQMLWAILVFGPLTYIIIKEILRSFVFTTHFTWLDPLVPLVYCLVIVTLLCGVQTLSINRRDLSSVLKN